MVHFQLAAKDIAYEEFDGEAVMLDLKSGKYFSLSKSASAVVSAILSGHSADDIFGASGGMEHVNKNTIGELLHQLIDYNLLEPVQKPEQSSQAPLDASKFIDAPLLVETFDDLAEMIVADPIHEVEEERGWPVLKAES
jgi:hypothetical protein